MLQVFCDFDGTITNRDSIVFLTEHFGAGPGYRMDILEAIKEGQLTVTEAIERELATVNISWEEAKAALRANIWVDKTFPSFVDWCRDRGYSLQVVSSGIKQVLDLFIGELDIPCSAHSVEIEDDGWRYRRNPENDKEVILGAASNDKSLVYVGDGTSDVAAIPYADFLFAKSYLAQYCDLKGVRFFPFGTFEDVRRTLLKLEN